MKVSALTQNLIRPKTLIASISPVLLTSAWALKEGFFKFPLFCLLLSSALMLQILSNIANDYFDGIKGSDNSFRVGPKRLSGTSEEYLQLIKKILTGTFIATLVLGLILSFYGGPFIAAIFGISLICSILYTAGPFAFSYNGIAEPFAFGFFGPIPCFCAGFMFSKTYSFYPFLLGCLPGLYSLMLITINNLRDVESDTMALKKTLIVKKGRAFGKKMILIALFTQVLITLILGLTNPKMLLSLVILPEAFYFYLRVKKSEEATDFVPLLKECAFLYMTSTLLWISFSML